MGCINKITGTTKLTGLLGSPVAHSISPLMHNEAFRLLNLDYTYMCFDVNEENLECVYNGLRSMNVKGFNCTMPNKTLMYHLVDNLSPAARMIGAVNTVVNENGTFVGYNTDGIGYIQSLLHCGHSINNKTMTLLGAGGTASSICVQAAIDGAKEIKVFNRPGNRFEHFNKLVKQVNEETNCLVTLNKLGDPSLLKNAIESSDILTNATSVGMSPNIDNCLVDDTMLRPNLVVSDIIYNPKETKLLTIAKSLGCQTFNGMHMLLYQGAAAFKLWTNLDMPVDEIMNKYFK